MESLERRVKHKEPAAVALSRLASSPLHHGLPFLRAGFAFGQVLFDLKQLKIGELWWSDFNHGPLEQIQVKRVDDNVVKLNGEYYFIDPRLRVRASAVAIQEKLDKQAENKAQKPDGKKEEVPEVPPLSLSNLSESTENEDDLEDVDAMLARYDNRLRNRVSERRKGLSEQERKRRVQAMMNGTYAQDEERADWLSSLRSSALAKREDEREERLQAERAQLLAKYGNVE